MAEFSFPKLPQSNPEPEKPPLTAKSTVVHASSSSGGGGGGAAAAAAPGSTAAASAPFSAPKPVIAIKPVQAEGRRNKVPLEKGFSQVDWLRLSRSGQDLRCGLGLRRDIPMDEVRRHSAPDDAWTVLSGRVYNMTPYMPYHPGGAAILMQAAGKDGTALFRRYHPWVNGHALLEACLLGSLKTSAGGPSPLGSSGNNGSGSGDGGGGGGDSSGSKGEAAADPGRSVL